MENVELNEISDKEKVFWEILDGAATLDIQHGHLKWTMSQLARKSGVSRSLIYYYFGKSKEGLLLEAIRFFNRFILGTTSDQIKEWESGNVLPSLKLARIVISKIPAIIPFYYLNRDKDNIIGREILEQRDIYVNKLTKFFPNLGADELEAVHATMFGLVFCPDLRAGALDIVCEKINKLM